MIGRACAIRVARPASASRRGPALGVLGVAAVGALLFDMLLLSRGLVLSFRDLLDRAGFDVRVLATDARAVRRAADRGRGRRRRAGSRRCREVEAVLRSASADAEIETRRRERRQRRRADSVRRTRDPSPTADVDDRSRAAICPETSGTGGRRWSSTAICRERSDLAAGSTLRLRGVVRRGVEALPPLTFTILGIAEFPFDDATAETVAGR